MLMLNQHCFARRLPDGSGSPEQAFGAQRGLQAYSRNPKPKKVKEADSPSFYFFFAMFAKPIVSMTVYTMYNPIMAKILGLCKCP
jgi:hypothetical protein